MDLDTINSRGLLLLGCGKMGSALLSGWLNQGINANAVWVLEPYPSEWLQSQSVHLNTELPDAPAVVLIAVKPQMMGDALPRLQSYGNGETLFISVAAGVTLGHYEDVIGAATPIIRAMPNTPAAIGQGITPYCTNQSARGYAALAEHLLQAVGQTVQLSDEGQIDAVTGVSGSGPAYVFHLIETLAKAGVAQGLPADLSLQLAKATVAGAGALAMQSDETPEQLRINVTSRNGTTQAALEVLMDAETGFPPLLGRAVKAAVDRSKELANG
ncbi:pyrroline-5-carboxylate reductase [Pseudaestuariivita rosea]|uniref:pyrroline-5-carboxylate reductase n=1 Tax=Pseudaestuariivita rosea TaxID=2763263 RepID=UPI001ABA9940|nr:pyrroline-5-carboxylate reductase [Pseudaestuariivita rosea]